MTKPTTKKQRGKAPVCAKVGDRVRLTGHKFAALDLTDGADYTIHRIDEDGWYTLLPSGPGSIVPPESVTLLKPAKAKAERPDRDAVWLCDIELGNCDDDTGDTLTVVTGLSKDSFRRRLRAIAKRLNNGELP